jgi:hypothetical protein
MDWINWVQIEHNSGHLLKRQLTLGSAEDVEFIDPLWIHRLLKLGSVL